MSTRSSPPPGADPRIGTPSLFLILVAVAALLAWVNETFVMTPDVYRSLLAERLPPEQIERQLALNSRFSAMTYAIVPVQMALTLAWTALIVQMVGMTGSIELRFAQAYRAAALAYPATLYGASVQFLWLVRRPPGSVDRAALATVPDSLARWSTAEPAWLETLLGDASRNQLLWLALFFVALRAVTRITIPHAATVTAVSWTILTLVKFSVAVLVA